MIRGGWTYIMASKYRGMTYIGVTAYLAQRVDQHRRDVGSAYCRKHGIRTLVLAEWHEDIAYAIAREKALKAWKQAWKYRLIEESNPAWEDLFDRIASRLEAPACAGATDRVRVRHASEGWHLVR